MIHLMKYWTSCIRPITTTNKSPESPHRTIRRDYYTPPKNLSSGDFKSNGSNTREIFADFTVNGRYTSTSSTFSEYLSLCIRVRNNFFTNM